MPSFMQGSSDHPWRKIWAALGICTGVVVAMVALFGVPEGIDCSGNRQAAIQDGAIKESGQESSGLELDSRGQQGKISDKKSEAQDGRSERRMDKGWIQVRTKKTPAKLCDAARDLLDGLDAAGSADYLDSGYLDLMGNLWFVLYRDQGQVRLSFVVEAEDTTVIQVSMSSQRLAKMVKG